MHTPRPYREVKGAGFTLREFQGDVNSGDLVWHQDKRDRTVTVIEGGRWSLQMETGLPLPLIEGHTYSIPAKTWHRLIKGQGNLRIKITELDMRVTESQLRRIIREEILRENPSYEEQEPTNHSKVNASPVHPDVVWATWIDMGGLDGKRIRVADFAHRLGVQPSSLRFAWDGTGLAVVDGYVQEMFTQLGESHLLEATMTAEYQGKTYKASPGVVALLKKYNWDGAKAIADGKFEWAKKKGLNPWSLIQAATIVGTGKPIQRKKATEVI